MLGGLTSSALSFLLLERYNRPNFALALGQGRARPGGRLGLQRRLVFTWALGTAVPVVVIVTAPAGLSPAQRADLAVPLVVVGFIALAFGFGLTVVASRSVTQPIDALRRSQQAVEEGDLSVAVRVDDGGEVGLLQAGFLARTPSITTSHGSRSVLSSNPAHSFCLFATTSRDSLMIRNCSTPA